MNGRVFTSVAGFCEERKCLTHPVVPSRLGKQSETQDGAGAGRDVDELLDAIAIVDELPQRGPEWTHVNFRPVPAGPLSPQRKPAQRPEGASRNVEVGGSGGQGVRAQRPEGASRGAYGPEDPEGPGGVVRGSHTGQPLQFRARPDPVRTGSCILRHLSGSARPMPGRTAAETGKPGVGR